MSGFQDFKLLVVNTLGLARDGMHIYIGFAAFVAAALVLRSARSFVVLLPGLSIALLAETIDLCDDLAAFGRPRWGASLHDILNTMLVPVVLVLLARRGLFCRGGCARAGCPTAASPAGS